MPLSPKEAVGRWAGRHPGEVVGVAVSGGGDSVALLHLARAALAGGGLLAVTVDHGLREGSAAEAAEAGRLCADLAVPHDVLRWEGEGRGNLQARAREARRRLIGEWARKRGVETVLLGHTADDQAETVLLRLARGSGVDGLAGMPEGFRAEGVTWARPLLGVTREALRAWLRARGIAWAEDPSNDDPRFDRARARALTEALAGLGLTRERLLRTAGHMARARAALDSRAAGIARERAHEDGGGLLLPLDLLEGFEAEDAPGRLLAAALIWVGGQEVRPRWEALGRLVDLVRAGRAATLHGCRVAPEGTWLRLEREARGAPSPRRFSSFADFVGRAEIGLPSPQPLER